MQKERSSTSSKGEERTCISVINIVKIVDRDDHGCRDSKDPDKET